MAAEGLDMSSRCQEVPRCLCDEHVGVAKKLFFCPFSLKKIQGLGDGAKGFWEEDFSTLDLILSFFFNEGIRKQMDRLNFADFIGV